MTKNNPFLNLFFFIITSLFFVSVIWFFVNKISREHTTVSQILHVQNVWGTNKVFYIGGWLDGDSVFYDQANNQIQFILAENDPRFETVTTQNSILVRFSGELPRKFKEWKLVMIHGVFKDKKNFIATDIVVKNKEFVSLSYWLTFGMLLFYLLWLFLNIRQIENKIQQIEQKKE